MKKLFLCIALLVGGAVTNLYAQVAPVGAGDKNLENRDVKGRSVELERVRRDADNPDAKKTAEARFAEIKEDFEKMQMANGDLQKQMGAGEISYKTVNDLSAQIQKSAVRLKSNLFPNAKSKKSKDKNKSADDNSATDLKATTDKMNAAIFDFAHNPIFSNPKYTADDSAKAQSDLETVINYSQVIVKQTEGK